MLQATCIPARRCIALAVAALAATGCSIVPRYGSTNTEYATPVDDRAAATPPLPAASAAAAPVRATLKVDGDRGQPNALVFLALSGGGSRSAYFSGQVMLKLQTVLPDVDLLAEVDVLSAVSGGTLPAAYYALSRDTAVRLPAAARQLAPSLNGSGLLAALKADTAAGTIACSEPLADTAAADLRTLLPSDGRAANSVLDLCAQSTHKDRRVWRADTVNSLMKRNYLTRLLGNLLWPNNMLRYWFTDFDRADIMAQTFADNLFDTPIVGRDLTLGELNPSRPYLVLNATNATEQALASGEGLDEMPFGSVFTFTDDDFRARIGSDIRRYSVARAVMASSAFPVVFPAMTLRDFRPHADPACAGPPSPLRSDCTARRYLHVFDGGNADNLGLKAIKRMILQQHADGLLNRYDRVIVILVDAFATPAGTPRTRSDPRRGLDFLLDTNVVEAVDSLLRANRLNLLREFNSGQLEWHHADCSDESRELPQRLCRQLAENNAQRSLPLQDRMVFYHIGFDDVKNPELRHRLNRISTSFSIDKDGVQAIDEAVGSVVKPSNPCLVAIGQLLQKEVVLAPQIAEARQVCAGTDVLPRSTQATAGAAHE